MKLYGLIFPFTRIMLIYTSKDYQGIGIKLPSSFYLNEYCINT